MSDLGRRLRHTLDEVAPPADLDFIVAHEPSLPFWRVGRALAYATVLVAAVGVTVVLLTRDGSDDTAVDSSVTTVEGTVTTVGEGEPPETDDAWTPQVLVPQNFVCSTYVEAFPCGLLFDGDPSMVWMAPNGGVDAVVQVTFDQPVEIIEMVFSAPPDEEIRLRNARVSEFTVVAEGYSAVHGQLTDEPGDQRFGLDNVVTTGVTITIESAFPGVQYEGREPFLELALGEIQFLGRIAVGSPAAVPPALDTRPLTGQWFGTTPDTEGLMVIHNDLIWDGEAFYALTRLGFGDQVVWRSADGIEWERYETIALAGELGLTGVYNGPRKLLSVDGRLYAAGTANGRATVWVDDGSYPWRAIDVGSGAIRALLYHDGRFVALGDSVPPTDRPTSDPVDRHPVIWMSPDGETWGEAAGDELFGSVAWTSDLVAGPAGLLTIGFEDDGRAMTRAAAVFISEDGVTWSRQDPEFLDLTQVDSIVGWDGGYAAVGLDSRVLVSSDGIAWAPLGDPPEPSMPGGFRFRSGLAALGGRLVMVGGENFVPEGAEYNTTHPRAWSYVGDGQWTSVGDFEWFHLPGVLYTAVVGGDTMVVHGETDVESWALYTFVADTDDFEPAASADWTLQPGDVLAANDSGVLTGRDELVSWAVTGPVGVALPDLTGGIVFATPDSTSIWRVRGPGAPVEEVFSADGIAAEGAGPPKLYQVFDRTGQVPGPSVVFTIGVVEPITGWTVDEVWAVPLDGADALLPGPLAIQTPGEGGVTGLGWLDVEGVFVMSEQSDGGSTLSLWDAAGEVAWPSNPESYETFCSGDPGFNGCLDAVAVIPGTSRIAYVVHDLPGSLTHNEERVTELVIYDLATESEVERVTILAGPGYSTDEWFVHASQSRVVLTWTWAEQNEDGQWHYPTASAVYDLGSGSVFGLPFDGVASIVP